MAFKYNFNNFSNLIYFGDIDYNNKWHHPHEKNVNLLKKIILHTTSEGDLVFDGFIGSGSTAIAAMETRRNYLGCELDKKYYELAQKRINNYLKQCKLFV